MGAQARKIIRIWDELRGSGSLERGVRIRKGLGLIKAVSTTGMLESDLPTDLDIKIPDHLILATALKCTKETDRKVILVSRDINMRVIADAIGMPAEDFQIIKLSEIARRYSQGIQPYWLMIKKLR